MIKLEQGRSIQLGAPGEEISIQDLQTIIQRFKQLSQIREQRVKESLLSQQRVFLELLPLIFHSNLPSLPGFVSQTAAAGIAEYHPSALAIDTARQLTYNFEYTHVASHVYPIEGLFLFSSIGRIAAPRAYDLDIWLFYHANLAVPAIETLRQKAAVLEMWGDSLGLQVRFSLLSSKQFKLGENLPKSPETNSQTQHFMLLDEFYRSGIYIAGKSPAWWVVPTNEEANYSGYLQHLVKNRFMHEHELVDLGGFEAVPAKEFTNAMLWYLHEALKVPQKALLKLFLMESYVSEYPQTRWLCKEQKETVYLGDLVACDIEPYQLIYQKIERYLAETQGVDRLSLVRHCFYLKVIGTPEENSLLDVKARAAKERFIQQVARNWNWPANTIAEFKQNQALTMQKAITEHVAIVQQLTYCYRLIMRFTNLHAILPSQKNSHELKLIIRKLHAFLEKKPGKIEIISKLSEVVTKENVLSIVENNFNDEISGWAVYLRSVEMSTAANFEPTQKFRTLIEVFCWLVINELYNKNMMIIFSSQNFRMTEPQLRLILRQINLFFMLNFNADSSLEAYQTQKQGLFSMVIINMAAIDDQRNCLISERSDPLSYGLTKQCFINTTSRISLSSWGDITTTYEEGLEGLFNCLIDIINNNQKPISLKNVKFVCHMRNRARDIIFRVEVIFSVLIKLFSVVQTAVESPRYILPGGTAFYLFQHVDNTLAYKVFASEKLLLSELSSLQTVYSPVHLDKAVLDNTPIPLIYELNRPQTIQFFYYDNKTDITVYVVDEKGSLYIRKHNNANADQLLKQYSIFFESILSRTVFEHSLMIEYYEIESKGAAHFSCNPLQLNISLLHQSLSLRITGEDTDNGIIYTIYCNEKEFSSLDHGHQVFHAAYRHILQFRNVKSNYPIHITDIDLPLSAFKINNPSLMQTIHYLNYKQKLEEKFNI